MHKTPEEDVKETNFIRELAMQVWDQHRYTLLEVVKKIMEARSYAALIDGDGRVWGTLVITAISTQVKGLIAVKTELLTTTPQDNISLATVLL